MTIHTKHAPGTFSWAELATTDADGAKKFYGSLLGWTYDGMLAGPGRVYSMSQGGAEEAAARDKRGGVRHRQAALPRSVPVCVGAALHGRPRGAITRRMPSEGAGRHHESGTCRRRMVVNFQKCPGAIATTTRDRRVQDSSNHVANCLLARE